MLGLRQSQNKAHTGPTQQRLCRPLAAFNAVRTALAAKRKNACRIRTRSHPTAQRRGTLRALEGVLRDIKGSAFGV